MYRLSKILCGVLCASVLALNPGVSSMVSAEEQTAEEISSVELCDPDEYVLIPGNYNSNSIYDHQGNLVGKISAYIGDFGPSVFAKDSLISSFEDGKLKVVRLADGSTVAEFPSDGSTMISQDDVFLVMVGSTQQAMLYADSGELLYERQIPFAADEWGYSGMLLSTAGGYLIIFTGDEGNTGFWVSRDGSEYREITSDLLRQIIAYDPYSLNSFGDYLYAYDYENQFGRVFDLDGTVYLDHLIGAVWDYDGTGYDSYYYEIIDVYTAVDGIYMLYDTDLNIAGQISVDAAATDRYYTFQREGGYMMGLPLEELENRICAGVIPYNGDEVRPYARNENLFYIYNGEQLSIWELYHDEIPDQMNGRYLVTTQTDEDYNVVYRLRDIQTHEIVVETPLDGSYSRYELQKDSFLYYSYQEDTARFSIYDNDWNLLYSTTHAYLSTWQNGYYFGSRGIYSGIMNEKGEWITREVYYEE